MPSLIPGPGGDPIPLTDSGLQAFAVAFASVWLPSTFNAVLPLASTVQAASAAFDVSLAVASSPATRTTVAIAAKNDDRRALITILRSAIRLAQAAYVAGSVTEAQVNALGVRANSLIRTPVADPVFPPVIAIDFVSVGSVNLRITQVDQFSGQIVSTRKFPSGIIGVDVERQVGSGPFLPVGLRKAVRINDVVTDFAAGTSVRYRARYVTARGLVSPFSLPVSAAVL